MALPVLMCFSRAIPVRVFEADFSIKAPGTRDQLYGVDDGGVSRHSPGSPLPDAATKLPLTFARADGGGIFHSFGAALGTLPRLPRSEAFAFLRGSSDIHDGAWQLFTGYHAKVNNIDWICSKLDGARGETFAARSIAIAPGVAFKVNEPAFNFATASFLFPFSADDARSSPTLFSQVADGVFEAKPSRRVGVILCADSADQETPRLAAPFAVGSIGYIGHKAAVNTGFFSYDNIRLGTQLNPLAPFLPLDDTALLRAEVAGTAESSGSVLLLYSKPSRAQLSTTYSGFAYYLLKAGVAYDKQDDAHYCNCMMIGSLLVSGWQYAPYISDNNGAVAELTVIPPTPAGYTAYSDISGGFKRYSIQASCVAHARIAISAAIAARKESGYFYSASQGSGWAQFPVNAAVMCGAKILGSDSSAMFQEHDELDFGDKCLASFFSSTIQRLDAPFFGGNADTAGIFQPDASFSKPEVSPVSESPVGVGIADGIFEAVASRPTKTFLKAGSRIYGTLADEDIVCVALKSHRHISTAAPFDPEVISFPRVGAGFLFREKRITQTGVSFVPHSSNQYSSPIEGPAKTQRLPVDIPSPTTWGPALFNFGWGCNSLGRDLSGTWWNENSVIVAEDAGTPAGSCGRIYNESTHTIGGPLFLERPLTAFYPPNQGYDEAGLVAGAIVSNGGLNNAYYIVGKFRDGASASGAYGYAEGDVEERHPFPGLLNGARFSHNTKVMPILSGKEYLCGTEDIYEKKLQSGLFHFIGSGSNGDVTAIYNTYAKLDKKTRVPLGQANTFTAGEHNLTQSITHSPVSFSHKVDYDTELVEVYVKWSPSLQSPGAYRVTAPLPNTVERVRLDGNTSVVSPFMFVRRGEIDDVSPVLVAEVWARAVGNYDVTTTCNAPEVFQLNGEYKYKVRAFNAPQGSLLSPTIESVDMGSARFIESMWTGSSYVFASEMGMRYLGAFPFNRAQTQRLLDGEEVEPTYWFLDDEGSALESQPVTVPWHNATFGTYKLKFRLVTE